MHGCVVHNVEHQLVVSFGLPLAKSSRVPYAMPSMSDNGAVNIGLKLRSRAVTNGLLIARVCCGLVLNTRGVNVLLLFNMMHSFIWLAVGVDKPTIVGLSLVG